MNMGKESWGAAARPDEAVDGHQLMSDDRYAGLE